MSEKSVNPLSAKAEVLFSTLENVSHEIVDWLITLTNGNNLCDKDFYNTQNIIDSIKKQNSFVCNWLELFKPYFLLHSNLPECFDRVCIKQEMIKNIDNFFDKETGILNSSLLPIFDDIKEKIMLDEDYRNAYQRAKENGLQRFSLKERICRYMQIPKFQPKLIEEMEGIAIGKDDKHILPTLVWGKNVYKAFYSLYYDTEYEGIYDDVLLYNKNQNAAKVFFHVALEIGNIELIKAVFRDDSFSEMLETIIKLVYDRQSMDNFIYTGFMNEYSDRESGIPQWVYDYKDRNIERKIEYRLLFELIIDILKEKTTDEKLCIKFIPMLDKHETCYFFEDLYSALTKKQKEKMLSLICKKITFSDFIHLVSENDFNTFNVGILGDYSFTLLQKWLSNYEAGKFDESLRQYLNKFYESLDIRTDFKMACEYFRQLHCINVIIEQEQREEEKSQKELEQPSTLDFAVKLKEAPSYDEIREAGKKFRFRNETNDNHENGQLHQIVYDSIMNVINETGELFLEMIRLSWFASHLINLYDYIVSGDDNLKQKLLEKCRIVMALLRKVMACQGEEETKKLATEASQYAFCLIRDNSGYGKAIKPYILALRSAVDPLVSNNLKCTDRNIAAEIFRRLHFREDNEVSKKLRQDLANSFTEFLKPIPEKDRGDPKDRLQNYSEKEKKMPGFDITKREPNAYWRYAYVRALVDLGIDNDGKGHFFHSVLDKVAESDISPMVREAAQESSKELKNLRDGYASGSPKRHLLQAYWWLRRAHLQTLGVEINNEEALKVRVTEYR